MNERETQAAWRKAEADREWATSRAQWVDDQLRRDAAPDRQWRNGQWRPVAEPVYNEVERPVDYRYLWGFCLTALALGFTLGVVIGGIVAGRTQYPRPLTDIVIDGGGR